MRNLKKVLSMVLCVAMMLSVMVMGTGAAFADQNKIENTEAVDMCVALKIIDGKENNMFDPAGNVTRAEMCKMICVALNGGKAPILSPTANTSFTDTKGHWAAAYIEACFTQGIVSGVGANMFQPDASVTPTQAAKMLLVALGYKSENEGFTGPSWAVKVNIVAAGKHLYDDLVNVETDKAMNRDDAAQMIYNTLNANMVEYKTDLVNIGGQWSTQMTVQDKVDAFNNKITFLSDKYDSTETKGEMTKFSYNSTKAEWTYTVNSVEVTSKTDFTDFIGMNVKAVYDKDEVVYGIVNNDSSIILAGQISDLPKLKADDDSMKVDGTTYKFDDGRVDGVEVYAFGSANAAFTATSLNALAGNVASANVTQYDELEFAAIDNDNDGKIDSIRVLPFTVAKVTYVSSTKFTAGGQSYTIEDVNVYDGIAKNDYVAVYAIANTADETDTFVKAEKISGKITAVDGQDVKINDTWYTIDNDYKGVYTAGTTMTDAVVVNGFIFDADATNTKAVKDYAVVLGTDAGGVSGTQAKLLFSDGSKKVVDTDKRYTAKLADGSTANPDAIANGALVTYKTNGDGEYILTAADASTSGFDKADQGANKATVTKVSNSSDNAGYIEGASIADDAVIFVNYETSSYKVITGAQLKKMAVSDFTDSFANSFFLATKTNNVYNVDMAYLSVGSSSVNDADTYYGYITGVQSVENADTDIVKQVTMQTANGEKTYLTDTDSITGYALLAKRNAVEFKLNADGEINEVVAGWDVDNTTAGVNGMVDVAADADGYAVIGISAIAPTLQFQLKGQTALINQVDVGSGVMKYLDLDSDTVYLYIENTDAVAADKTDISTANDDTATDTLIPNAFVVWDKDGDVKLVVYDVDNEIAE